MRALRLRPLSPRRSTIPRLSPKSTQAAEIHPPSHGFTIEKVGDMLRSEHIRTLPRDVKRSSVLVALEAVGAPIQDVIQDAMKRDQALDTFESVQEKALNQLEAQKTAGKSTDSGGDRPRRGGAPFPHAGQ